MNIHEKFKIKSNKVNQPNLCRVCNLNRATVMRTNINDINKRATGEEYFNKPLPILRSLKIHNFNLLKISAHAHKLYINRKRDIYSN